MTKNLNLSNTLSNKKEKFVPINNNEVGMYVCGPTVYDFPHIGNARPLVVFDVLFRILKKIYGKNKITYVRNITDIDDKIIESSKKNNKSTKVLTETITTSLHKDCKYLNCLEPSFEPKATQHIKEMITKKIARFSSLAQNADDLKFGLNKGIVEINNKIDTSVFL